jgi:hypothetical protein
MSEKTAELLERLKAQVATLTTEDRWRCYLAVQSTFHAYSFRNTLLIMVQRPDATRVAGFHAWKALGRSVKKGEKGIGILAPMAIKPRPTADDPDPSSRLRFRLAYVFDVSQTEGDDLPASPAATLTGAEDAAAAVWDRLTAFAASRSIPVDLTDDGLPPGANGSFCRETGCVRIRPSNPPLQRAKTLAHELGHALLHADASDSHERPIMEVEAESVAYIVLHHFGLDTGDYSFGYVALWSQEKDLAAVLTASGTRIASATKAILSHRHDDEGVESMPAAS